MQKQHSRLDAVPASAKENLKNPDPGNDPAVDYNVDDIMLEDQVDSGKPMIAEEIICPKKKQKSDTPLQFEVCLSVL